MKRELEALNQIKELEEMKKDRAIKILENKNSQTKIRLLRKQKKLDDEIKMQREKDVILAKSRERNLGIFLAISLIITGLIVFLLYRNVRNARAIKSANMKLEQLTENLKASNTAIENTLQEVNAKNEIIELKNSQILESINYAKRIQEASLPKTDELAAIAKDSFALNKPKDIISGDFYIVSAFTDQQNQVFDVYIVGDCTGHGVPGAMLSLLCSSLVRQSMKMSNITKPAELLNDVNERLRSFFRNKEDDSFKDGMDIACCVLDKKNRKLYFSGAGRPLLCIRKKETIELKGEKHHIGFSNTSYDFNDQELELQSGDSVYLFTDGFTDQFNGTTRKRFMTKGLKELLCAIQHEPMKNQEKILDKAFEDWRGEYVQMDDVCVLGIRIE
ncbi:MAG: SpoIIE family protein phosphatase [Bacteroidia bacterium]|nr:SpoIIE family protein phosphatase [Bacteroidia bacterium]